MAVILMAAAGWLFTVMDPVTLVKSLRVPGPLTSFGPQETNNADVTVNRNSQQNARKCIVQTLRGMVSDPSPLTHTIAATYRTATSRHTQSGECAGKKH